MHIFVDETGSFTGIGKLGSLSLAGALVVPDARSAVPGWSPLQMTLKT